MNSKQEKWLEGKIDQFVEESIKEDGSFCKGWFSSNIKSVIKEIMEE